eukprot:GILK01004220.1.p1 GENE.GILK01004220.1~~GILK01004220.1.p1  ORF type:complete len:721 (+),score=144.52 GILK01004220.1:74-2236(+)
MFLLKKGMNLIFGGNNDGGDELVRCTGMFSDRYLGQKRCLYMDASASIRYTNRQYEFELVVAAEEDSELMESETDQPKVMVFPLTASESFMRYSNDAEESIGFTWTHDGRAFYFEVQSSATGNRMAALFQNTIARCIFENTNRVPHDNVPAEEWAVYCPVEGQRPAPPTPQKAMPTPQKAPLATPHKAPLASTPSPVKYPDLSPVNLGLEMVSVRADLYMFDQPSGEFRIVSEVQAKLHETADFEFSLNLFKEAELVLSQKVSNNMHLHMDKVNKSVIWMGIRVGDDPMIPVWSLVFSNSESESTFKELLQRCLWETNRREDFSESVKAEDRAWIQGATRDDVEMEDDDGRVEDVDMMDFEEDANDRRLSRDSVSPLKALGADENQEMAVGMVNDRAYVVRGSQIGVFKQGENDLEYLTKIPVVQTADGTKFCPTQVMLSEQDSKLLLLHPSDNKKVCYMDLNRGQVVEEWTTDSINTIQTIAPLAKYAPRTGESNFVGMNSNGMFRMDPRLPGRAKMVESQKNFYAPKTKALLSCMATNQNGHIALGSETGQIRLFNKLDKRAKTALPGLGDPIIGLDVTADGSWLLATTDTYLLVVHTVMPSGKTGFGDRMGDDKPVPRKLMLHPRDLQKFGISEVSFTPAHFNLGEGIDETSIVTSTGPFIITWNFRKVKQNKLHEYTIKHVADQVVADQFAYGQQEKVIVALPNDVTVEKRTTRRR